jgi:hypothetical protein
MKTYEGLDIWIRDLLTSALVGNEWSASCSGCFIPRERSPSNNLIGGWVGVRADLDMEEKILDPTGIQTPWNKLLHRIINKIIVQRRLHQDCYCGIQTCWDLMRFMLALGYLRANGDFGLFWLLWRLPTPGSVVMLITSLYSTDITGLVYKMWFKTGSLSFPRSNFCEFKIP